MAYMPYGGPAGQQQPQRPPPQGPGGANPGSGQRQGMVPPGAGGANPQGQGQRPPGQGQQQGRPGGYIDPGYANPPRPQGQPQPGQQPPQGRQPQPGDMIYVPPQPQGQPQVWDHGNNNVNGGGQAFGGGAAPGQWFDPKTGQYSSQAAPGTINTQYPGWQDQARQAGYNPQQQEQNVGQSGQYRDANGNMVPYVVGNGGTVPTQQQQQQAQRNNQGPGGPPGGPLNQQGLTIQQQLQQQWQQQHGGANPSGGQQPQGQGQPGQGGGGAGQQSWRQADSPNSPAWQQKIASLDAGVQQQLQQVAQQNGITPAQAAWNMFGGPGGLPQSDGSFGGGGSATASKPPTGGGAAPMSGGAAVQPGQYYANPTTPEQQQANQQYNAQQNALIQQQNAQANQQWTPDQLALIQAKEAGLVTDPHQSQFHPTDLLIGGLGSGGPAPQQGGGDIVPGGPTYAGSGGMAIRLPPNPGKLPTPPAPTGGGAAPPAPTSGPTQTATPTSGGAAPQPTSGSAAPTSPTSSTPPQQQPATSTPPAPAPGVWSVPLTSPQPAGPGWVRDDYNKQWVNTDIYKQGQQQAQWGPYANADAAMAAMQKDPVAFNKAMNPGAWDQNPTKSNLPAAGLSASGAWAGAWKTDASGNLVPDTSFYDRTAAAQSPTQPAPQQAPSSSSGLPQQYPQQTSASAPPIPAGMSSTQWNSLRPDQQQAFNYDQWNYAQQLLHPYQQQPTQYNQYPYQGGGMATAPNPYNYTSTPTPQQQPAQQYPQQQQSYMPGSPAPSTGGTTSGSTATSGGTGTVDPGAMSTATPTTTAPKTTSSSTWNADAYNTLFDRMQQMVKTNDIPQSYMQSLQSVLKDPNMGALASIPKDAAAAVSAYKPRDLVSAVSKGPYTQTNQQELQGGLTETLKNGIANGGQSLYNNLVGQSNSSIDFYADRARQAQKAEMARRFGAGGSAGSSSIAERGSADLEEGVLRQRTQADYDAAAKAAQFQQQYAQQAGTELAGQRGYNLQQGEDISKAQGQMDTNRLAALKQFSDLGLGTMGQLTARGSYESGTNVDQYNAGQNREQALQSLMAMAITQGTGANPLSTSTVGHWTSQSNPPPSNMVTNGATPYWDASKGWWVDPISGNPVNTWSA